MPNVELLIIGGGAAGLSAGLYAARARLDSVLLERMGTGGQLINVDRVENYPGFPEPVHGYDLGPAMAQQAMDAGLRVEYGEAMAIRRDGDSFLVETDAEPFRARAVIVAAGSKLARLGVPGEAEFEGNGVSYCATCDGEFFRDQPVAVVGGGDSAFDEALYLADVASSVTIIHRRAAYRAAAVLVERARTDGRIRLVTGSVAEIVGDETVRSVRLAGANGAAEVLETSGVFIYVGLLPNSSLLDGLAKIDAGGHISVDLWMRTSVPGLFAAGDIRSQSSRQLISAAGDGATAALAAERYLRRGEWPRPERA